MNYLEIVLKGYLKENIKEHLDNYFFREFKKAEKENYELNEFFEGCLNVVQGFEKELQEKVNEIK
ncbi:MAG TPA: hypothetical protein VMU83_11685 [Hanamia sp.]|nr:hypothetical protein [Hanamia sp.]